MSIIKPILPPKEGYVERVRIDGAHYYEPTAKTLEKIREYERLHTTQDDTDALMVDHELRLTMLELGLTE